ncbi:MAG: SDR family oxidoreductase [Bacteroidota bacterium]
MTNCRLENTEILVTGGAGFIGSNLINTLLEQNNRVACLDNFSTGKRRNIAAFMDHPGFKLVEGDIRDIETCRKAMKGVKFVLHQAALGSVPRSIDDPKTTNDVNIGGFINMLIAARDEGVKRFIYAASSSTYGDNYDLPKREENIGKPLSPYAITKYVNELYAGIFSDLYGIKTIGLRYFNVFGPRQDPDGAYAAVIPRFILNMMKLEQPVINGDGTNTRDFTYIENVIIANQLAAMTENEEALNKVYNIACGEQINLNKLFLTLRDKLTITNPEIGKIEPVFGNPRIGDVMHSLASIEKAKKYLDYQPVTEVREGLKYTVEWFVSEYGL